MTKHTILFLAANPKGTDPRALGEETRLIREELERSGCRDCFTFETRWAMSPLDVLRELRRLKPTVVHFSGHGGRKGLFFEAADGRAKLVSSAALAETFGAIEASPRLVVLSACYSKAQAEALLPHVDCVVGVGSARHDIARAFAIGFYGGLGEGESVAAAHKQGRAAVSLEGLRDRDRPQLKIRDGVDAARLVLAEFSRVAPPSLPRPARLIALSAKPANTLEIVGPRDVAGNLGAGEMNAQELAREIYVRLLAGYPEDAILRAAMLAEAVLKHAFGMSSSAEATLGELIGLIGEAGRAARDVLGDDLIGSLGWLNRLRAEAGQIARTHRGDWLEDAERATELATRAAVQLGLLAEPSVHDARRAAARQASEPAPAALLRLDRAEQRRHLDDLLALQHRVLVVLIHGESGQGHDHFGEIATWRTRAVAKGRWRQLHVEWPAPSPSSETRLGFLLESFASAVGATFAPPPLTPAAGVVGLWADALEPALSACDRSRERLFVRHAIGWLDGGDIDLVARYLRMVWLRLAARPGAQVMCCLELRRAERAGFPLTRAWRTARAEHRIARAIATLLEEQAMPGGGHCAALPELTSATSDDLADWLRVERRLARSSALAEARQLVTMTRGGRFDLVVQRLASLHLDTRR